MTKSEIKLFRYLEQESIEKSQNKRNKIDYAKEYIVDNYGELIDEGVELLLKLFNNPIGELEEQAEIVEVQSKLNPYDVVVSLFACASAERLANRVVERKTLPMATLVGSFATMFKFGSKLNGFIYAQRIIEELSDVGAYTLQATSNNSVTVVMNLMFTDELKEKITHCRYPHPMLVKPSNITKNSESAHLTRNESVILKHWHNDITVGLDVLNILSQVELCLCENTLGSFSDKPKKPHASVQDKTTWDLEQSRAREAEQYILDHDNLFYLGWKYDFRGRVYSSGHYVNIQGSEYKKASIEFKNKVIIPLT